jgi:hypothetical protein
MALSNIERLMGKTEKQLMAEVSAAVMKKLSIEKLKMRPLGKGEKYVLDENGVWQIESAGERFMKSFKKAAPTDLAGTILAGRHVATLNRGTYVAKRAGFLPGDPNTLTPTIARPTVGLSDPKPSLEQQNVLTVLDPHAAETAQAKWIETYCALPQKGLSNLMRPTAAD